MYLLIPEKILTSRKVTAEEKILLSYFFTLHKSGKKVYAKPEYLESLLGLSNVHYMLENLGERNFLVSTLQGKELAPHVIHDLNK